MTSFGTTQYALFATYYEFLYALRRDFVWNNWLNNTTSVSARFLYALRRDLVWNQINVIPKYQRVIGLLYALRRDFVWNPTSSEGPVTSTDAAGSAGESRRGRNRF